MRVGEIFSRQREIGGRERERMREREGERRGERNRQGKRKTKII